MFDNKNKCFSFNVNFMSNKNNYALKETQKQIKGEAVLLIGRVVTCRGSHLQDSRLKAGGEVLSLTL
jgi:hypothetical protein